jgi:hypothetical protein
MMSRQIRCVLIACSLAAMLSLTATCDAGLCGSCGLCNLFGGGSSCATAQSTYTPPYYATAYAPACAAPACAAPACSSCAPQVVQYAPYVSYRPTIIRPVTTYYMPTAAAFYPAPACSSCAAPACSACAAPVTSYYPAPACNTCAAPVTAFRPVGLFTQEVRLIPYTSYRMPYLPVTYVGYAPGCSTCASPCASSCAAPCASTCGSCSSCGTVSYEGAATTYQSPGCATSQPEISGTYAPPASMPAQSAPTSNPVPSSDYGQGQPKTFQDQRPAGDTLPSTENKSTNPDNKSSTDPSPESSPRPEPKLNSLPGPQLGNPDNRTTSSPVRQAIYLVNRPTMVATPAKPQTNSGWRESRD